MDTERFFGAVGSVLPVFFVIMGRSKEIYGMPIYEYECKACGVHFERKQKWQDDPIRNCPECSGEVRKVIHPAGIVFKGTGFYKTDYSSSRNRQEKSEKKSAEEKGSSPTENKTDTKAEVKPATKAEPKTDSKS